MEPASASGATPAPGPGPASLVELLARPAEAALLDVRDEVAFARGHLAGAGRCGASEFAARRAELPPRHLEVFVVHDGPDDARAAARALVDLGYPRVRWLDEPLVRAGGAPLVQGPAARLWRAAPLLEELVPGLAPGRSLDVACGAARESVLLALHGWEAEGWDHDPEALGRAHVLAGRCGVSIRTACVELSARHLPEPAHAWDLVVVCRFLDRELFGWLERAVAPGGRLLYETFRVGQERFGRPKNPRYLLQPGELRDAFPALRVERYEESDAEHGPVLARLIARRD